MSKSKLIINFIQQKGKKKLYDSIIFLNKTHKINCKTLKIDIDDKYFNSLKERIIVDLGLKPVDILQLSAFINILSSIQYISILLKSCSLYSKYQSLKMLVLNSL